MIDREAARRIGVYGGTFDPVHRGHLAAARAAREAMDLDLVLLVPAGDPYHRDAPQAPAAERLALVEAAVADEPGMAASRVDIDRCGPTYTVDTLRDLHAQHPDARLVLLLGSDALAALPTWRDPEGILALASVVAFAHPGDPLVMPELAGDITLIPFEPLDITATQVREAIASGAPIDALVPPPVARRIAQRGLYRAS